MEKLVLTFLLAFLVCYLPKSSYSEQGTIQTAPVSPRLAALSKDLGARNGSALESFWQEVTRQGTPLIETIKGDERNVLVTFLWRSQEATNVVLMCDFGANVRSRVLTRLLSTDVWYKTYRMPNDARFFYQLSVDDPNFPFEGEAETKYPTKFQSDPLNPRRYDFAKPNIFSVVELPAAPSLELSTPDSAQPHGVVGRFSKPLASKILGNERDIWVYKPPGYNDAAERYPLLIFGASYINQIRLPVILDNLIAHRRVPPVVAIFVGFPPSGPGQNLQDEESGGEKRFSDFIATELLPWVRERVHVTTDPRRIVIGGASAGGHSAACVALDHPEAIGNVLAQSGAFWRGIGHTARYWGDPAHDEGREGFALAVASRPAPSAKVRVRFYLTIGRLENTIAFNDGLISMLHASRHVRDVLQARGYDVTLRETSGGHDPYNWETALPDALVALLSVEPPTTLPKK
jgi:enterochelin esterase-like enzyme